jgi:LacI family transcriptional regulator
MEGVLRTLRRMGELGVRPGVDTYNTLMAAGAVRAFERAGLRVPADVSLASADLSPIATEGKPRITAAGSNPEKLGEAAARLVLDATATDLGSFTDLMLPAQVFIGDTTGPATT